MERVPGLCVIAHTTRGGNLIYSTVNRSTKGNRKRRTISRGNGLGGRRKPPSLKQLYAQSRPSQEATMRAVDAKKKQGARQ